MPLPDLDLLSRAQAGDAAAMEELLGRHEKQIYRFGLRMCGSEDDARDVLQETLIAAFKHLPEFRGDADLSTWLYQVARSFCSRSRRRHVGEPARKDSLDAPAVRALASPAMPADAAAHARELGETLQAAILGLPERSREVIVLKDVEGLSAEEVAQVVGEGVPAVKSRIHRARLELRKALSAVLDEDPGATGGCPELAEAIAAYSASEIDQATCSSIEAHLTACPSCAGACDSLKRTVSLCRQIPGGQVPAPIRAAVRRALAQITRG